MTKNFSKIELLKLLDDEATKLGRMSKESLMAETSVEAKTEEWKQHCELAANIRWASNWVADLPDAFNIVRDDGGKPASDVPAWEVGNRPTP